MAASLVILALVFTIDQVLQAQAQPRLARVAGHVRVGGEAVAVQGARVTLLPTLETYQPGIEPPRMLTGLDGRYVFDIITPGAYLVAAAKEGFPRTSVVAVRVSAGKAVDDVDVFLERGGVITGRIVDENREPLRGVIVEALNTIDRSGAVLRHFVRTGPSSTTDDRGEYRVFDLPPGLYLVEATLGCPPRCIGPRAIATPRRYTYYPGVNDPSTAQLVPITAGQIVPWIDFAVESGADLPPHRLETGSMRTRSRR